MKNRLILAAVCAFVLALAPAVSWAQSTTPQDENRSTVNQSDQDLNRSQSTTTQDSDTGTPTTVQQERTTESHESSSQTRTDAEPSVEGLPATAGELPLLALIGALSLAAAVGSRLVRAKSLLDDVRFGAVDKMIVLFTPKEGT
jgi:hypothetical protein